MGVRFRELLLLLAVCALASTETTVRTAKKDVKDVKDKDGNNFIDQYDYDSADEQEVLFNEDRPCPRDCTCSLSQGYRIAKCDRLEVGTQKFGDDITDLVIEHADPNFPIQLDEFIFKKLGLHQVATIKIVNSTIGYISPNAFHGLHDLYAVNLYNNKLTALHPETFATNKKLLLLTLSNNPLNISVTGPEHYFLNASSVQELDLSYCNIRSIKANTFKNMPGLMYLNVAGNNLSDIDPDTFKTLLDLEELDLSDNKIKTLPHNIFSENTELATLHILKNPIESVYGLKISDLLTLNAGQTEIKFVGPSMFNGMTYLANLNLSGNSIEKIHNQAFHKLVELNYLDLSYNDLDLISNILIKENIELDIFKISNNPRLKHFPKEGFECSADQFNIYLFDASNCGLEDIYDNSLATFTALSVVNLADNKIQTISNKVFSMCPKLVEINLANNLLTTLDSKIFEKNNELGKLNLQGNPLKVFSSVVFTHTPLLAWLDMSHAELTSLWKPEKNQNTSLVLHNLTFLNISYNRITEIKQVELDNLNKLRTLDISNNALACSRDFENLMGWLSKRKVSPNAVADSIANLVKEGKDEDEAYSWDFLTRKTCGSAIVHPVEPLSDASDEEIWERIDQDANGNMDLKNTLDDGKVADDTLTNKQDEYTVDDYKDDAADDDDDDEDEDDDGDDDGDDDDGGEDTDGDDADDVDLKVKLVEKPEPKPVKTPEIDIKLMDGTFDELEYEEVSSQMSQHGRYQYLWPIAIAVLGALLLLLVIGKVVMMMCHKRSQQMRYNSAIIAAMNQQGRTKKDCGLVYQQLSEELAGPATPKLSRYQPLPSVSVSAAGVYASSPFHHTNIVPEHV